jgi:hypothetical protein
MRELRKHERVFVGKNGTKVPRQDRFARVELVRL